MPTEYTVKQGDCVTSIAYAHGLFWETLWNEPANAALKELRKDPNVLLPGDQLTIPDLRPKEESCANESKHRFKLKGVPAKVKLRLLLDDEPRKNQSYRLNIEGQWLDGATDGDGYLECPLPPNAQSGTLYVGEGDTADIYHLEFGGIDPIDTDEGLRGRLLDLGYGVEDLAEALRAFQEKEGLPVTGQSDDATRAKVKARFGQ